MKKNICFFSVVVHVSLNKHTWAILGLGPLAIINLAPRPAFLKFEYWVSNTAPERQS